MNESARNIAASYTGAVSRLGPTLLATIALGACGVPSEENPRTGVASVRGLVSNPVSAPADTFLFLFPPGAGFPGTPVVPVYATAVSGPRIERGDPHFVFAAVQPNPWRLWAMSDGDANFRTDVDVLGQPTAGDAVSGGQEINVQPQDAFVADVSLAHRVDFNPPAFSVVGQTGVRELHPGQRNELFTLAAENLSGTLRGEAAFHIGIVDANGDGQADDADRNGLPDTTLQLALRYRPPAGTAPMDGDVFLPLLYDPSPVVRGAAGSASHFVAVRELVAACLGTATHVKQLQNGMVETLVLRTVPAGDYELIAFASSGQFWRVPNQLGPTIASQSVAFRVPE